MRIPIPQQSAQAWESFKTTVKPKNPGLIFDRFIQQDWRHNPDKEAKKTALKDVVEVSKKADTKLLQEWIVRWKDVAERSNAHIFTMKTDWRFVTGLGRKGPLETGFTFHRYGFPILPGSSVKGVARMYALYWLYEQAIKNEPALAKKESALEELSQIMEEEKREDFEKRFTETYKNLNPETGENLRAIFGTKAESGKTIFFDAIPAKVPELKMDIVNPHYPDYYGGDQPPTNWQSPKPSFFLTVAPNQEFLFAIGWKGNLDETAQKRFEMAGNVLKRALVQLGAGAKTSAGYGYWHEVKSTDKK